jgi:O-antigen/teichoic acid export membrane protein
MQISPTTLFLLGAAALLPLLAVAVFLWRRYYREDESNTARLVLKNSALPIAANLINKVIDFGFMAIVLRQLGVAGFGDYSIVVLIAGLYFVTISNWGLNDLTVREVVVDQSQASRLFSITLLLRWGITLLLFPVAAAVVGAYAFIGSPFSQAAVIALALLVLHLFPSALAAACSASFQVFQRMETPAIILVFTNIAKVLIGAIALFALPDVSSRVIALAAVALVVTTLNGVIFFVLQQRLLFPARFVWEWPTGRRLLREAFPLLLNSLLLAVLFRFDVPLLRAFSPASVGVYNAAYGIINVTQIVPPYFVAALFPLLARYAATDRAALDRAYRHALTLLQMIAWPVAVGVTLLASDIIALIAGVEYLPDAAVALVVLIWYLPLSYANGVTQYVLIALQRQSAITIAFGIAAVFNLTLNLLFIPLFGYVAAAAITIATEVVLLAPFMWTLRREGAQPQLLRLTWRPAVAAALMGGAMGAADTIHVALAILIAPPAYGAALWALGAFGVEERALARRVLGRNRPA